MIDSWQPAVRNYAMAATGAVEESETVESGGWEILTFDTTPGYTDTAPHPAAATQWKYRAIYRVDDHQVGSGAPRSA